jgi:hypothetical protein
VLDCSKTTKRRALTILRACCSQTSVVVKLVGVDALNALCKDAGMTKTLHRYGASLTHFHAQTALQAFSATCLWLTCACCCCMFQGAPPTTTIYDYDKLCAPTAFGGALTAIHPASLGCSRNAHGPKLLLTIVRAWRSSQDAHNGVRSEPAAGACISSHSLKRLLMRSSSHS